MRILITDQHLDGNDPEGFNADAWCAALQAEYESTAREHFPDAKIEVRIDRQGHNTSGYTAPVGVSFFDDEDVSISPQMDLDSEISQTANWLYDTRGDEFYE